MLLTPVFRRYHGAELSSEAMLYSKLRDDIGQQSLDSGYEKKWTPRFARRGAGNAANGTYPSIPTSKWTRVSSRRHSATLTLC
jgi:hypothetical protein